MLVGHPFYNYYIHRYIRTKKVNRFNGKRNQVAVTEELLNLNGVQKGVACLKLITETVTGSVKRTNQSGFCSADVKGDLRLDRY